MTAALKRPCRDPRHEGERWLPATEDFFDRCGRLKNGTPKLASYCRPCARRQTRERQRGQSRPRPEYYRTYRRDVIAADPERLADYRAVQRNARRRRSLNPRPHLWIDAPGAVPGRTPSGPIRALVERAERDVADVSRSAGYEPSTVAKSLKRPYVTLAMAGRILAALDVLPAEVGL